MFSTSILLVVFATFLLTEADKSTKAVRPAMKRNLAQFGFMVNCMSGRFAALDYNNYGNYCGSGMRGAGVPVDALDRCCKIHDDCYGRYEHCSPKYILYNSIMTGWHHTCSLTCGDTDPCRKAVCVCDKEAAECFAKHKYVFRI